MRGRERISERGLARKKVTARFNYIAVSRGFRLQVSGFCCTLTLETRIFNYFKHKTIFERILMGVKVAIIGGGPAGLYLGLLLKKADPRHQVTMLERNKPDSTFGWGVVFSDQTLENFRAADEATYRAITENFAHWDDIDVFVKGRVV